MRSYERPKSPSDSSGLLLAAIACSKFERTICHLLSQTTTSSCSTQVRNAQHTFLCPASHQSLQLAETHGQAWYPKRGHDGTPDLQRYAAKGER